MIEGFELGWLQSTVGNGSRSSSATAYLSSSVISRPNLGVITQTYATRLFKTNGFPQADPDVRIVELSQFINGMNMAV